MGNKLTKEIFIERSRAVHGDRYNYDKVVYLGTNKKVEIICKEHGSFFQTVNCHLRKNNCPKCSKEKKIHTRESFIKRSKEIHGDKYNYDKVIYIGSNKKVEIICKEHGSFFQKANNHIKGNTCFKCSKNKRTHTKEIFIKKCKEIHGDKYNYDKVVYKNTDTKVEIICRKHGPFFQKARCHIRGYNCPKCSKQNSTSSKEEFIANAINKHGDKYNYDKVVYKNTDTKVEIICRKHGSFFQVANNHLRNQGCKWCDIDSKKQTKEDFIKISKEAHGNKYNYDKVVYDNRSNKVIIICDIHGDFLQSPGIHKKGHGCPKCCHTTSKPEIEWINSFNKNILRNQLLKIKGRQFRPDGYDPTTKTVYEFNGDYWHGNPDLYKSTDTNKHNKKTFGELYKKTVEKENFLKKHGYTVVSIWESDFKSNLK